ncbi:MAG: hypothetical protein Sylvanvirus3_16 [Sylvanvirus sp.]|uniref:Uncharacterized protein n=1 Tax=Sylvanvirus sp. TaxID=2487774 RepID=A0A3G5AH76_9VIRU|nr:MAG: hypothetical protein Sylvanvirus3_16 [Sylvanvirus sp.]
MSNACESSYKKSIHPFPAKENSVNINKKNNNYLLLIGKQWIWNTNLRSGTWIWNDFKAVSHVLQCSKSLYKDRKLRSLNRTQRVIYRFLVWYPWKIITTDRVRRRPPLWLSVPMKTKVHVSYSPNDEKELQPTVVRVKWLIRRSGAYKFKENVVVNASYVDIVFLIHGESITVNGDNIEINFDDSKIPNDVRKQSIVPHMAFCAFGILDCRRVIVSNLNLLGHRQMSSGIFAWGDDSINYEDRNEFRQCTVRNFRGPGFDGYTITSQYV